jgi:hypothetical protein
MYLFLSLHGVQETGLLLLDAVLSGGQTQLGSVPCLLLAGLGAGLLDGGRASSDGFVHLLVESFHVLRVNTVLDVLAELARVGLFVVLLELVHVLADVATEDVLAVRLGVEFVGIGVVAWESLGGMWDVQTAVNGALESTEHLVTGGGSSQTSVQEASEWTWTFVVGFDVVLVTVNFGLTDVGFVELHLVQQSSSQEKAGAVVRGVVGEADVESELFELVSVGGADDNVASHSGVGYLADNIPVGASDNQAVFWRVELILVLSAEASSRLVVGLTVASASVFWLKSLEVSLVLLDLNQAVGSVLSSILIFSGHVSKQKLLTTFL